VVDIDASLSALSVSPEVVTAVERAGPFGSGNPEPVFALPSHRLTSVVPVGTDHLRLGLVGPDGARLGAMAFRAASGPFGAALKAAQGAALHWAGTLSLSRWAGAERAEFRVLDAAIPERR
jgi:single-stranded-DNA-specific exonuclease